MPDWLKKMIPLHPVTTGEVFPRRWNLIPGRLSVTLFFHEFETTEGLVTCWSYVSDGFQAAGQQEICVTLRLNPNDIVQSPPAHLAGFFMDLYQEINRGHRYHAGDCVEWSGFTNTGAARWKGLALLAAPVMKGVRIPGNGLCAILLDEGEFFIAREFGLFRILHRLSRRYVTYPYPPWSDRLRSSVAPLGPEECSVLEDVPRVQVAGASVTLEGHKIRLYLPLASKHYFQDIFQRLAPDSTLALITEPDPQSDGCLAWSPGDLDPDTLKPEHSKGSRISGSFIALFPESYENHGTVTEDGFVMHLTHESWFLLRQALKFGSNVPINSYTATGLSLEIIWHQKTEASSGRFFRFIEPLRALRFFFLPFIAVWSAWIQKS